MGECHDTCDYTGDYFLRLLVPFLNWEEEVHSQKEQELFEAYVDPQYVLGANINGQPENIAADKIPEKIASYAHDFNHSTYYIWYKPLGILLAHEGKHRVAFMRHHKQSMLAAHVRKAHYPAPNRIVIIAPTDEHSDEWLALLDGQYLQVLRRPRTSRFFLNAYGIKELRWQDVTDLPDEKLVMQEIYERKLHKAPMSRSERNRTIDLKKIRKQQHEDETIVDRSIHDLSPLNVSLTLSTRPFIVYILLPLIILFIIGIPYMTNITQIFFSIAFTLAGFTTGVIGCYRFIRFRGPKRIREISPLTTKHHAASTHNNDK
ncbi:hypothetical protein FACS189497_14920 [Betaproteobacteria bacterium]|nr:hypothetical protein FACS189497_14920 [Betaproteobacteria bacterium]